MKRTLFILLTALLLVSALSISAFAVNVVFVGYTEGNNANDGLSASTAKKSLGTADSNGAFGVVANGGMMVVSGKMYVGDNYTWNAKAAVTVTAVYGGKDYKNPVPATNPAGGALKIKEGCTLTVASDLTLDDLILFQESQKNTILVKSGATFTVTDKIVSMSSTGKYPIVVVEKGGKAVLNGGIFGSVSGDGEIVMGAGASIASSTNTPATNGTVAYINYSAGKDDNNGLSDATPKRGLGTTDSKGVASVLKKGGTLVISGKMYVATDYAWCVSGDTLFTANYGGKSYINQEPASNPASGVLKIKPGETLTIASNVTMDNMILFQENAQSTILVSGGATLTINESVITMSNREHFMKIIVTAGSTAIINGGTYSSISGPGTIKLGKNVKVLEENASAEEKPTPIAREITVCYMDNENGNNKNDGKTAETAVKTYGDGVFKHILMGGTVVVSGVSAIGGSGADVTYTMPTLAKPLTFTSVYDGKDYTGKAEFRLSEKTTFAIASDVIFDNILLVRGKTENAIRVKRGATLTVTDTVRFRSEADSGKHYNIIVEEGAIAILSAEAKAQCTVSGDGTILDYVDGMTEILNQHMTANTVVELTIGSKTAYINGKAHTLDAAPINRNSRTMLPIRFLANAFGIDNDGILWDGATRTATLKNASVTIVVTIDAPTMTVNGQAVALDSPAIIESNRTYLPVRAIANALGVSNDNIFWEAPTNTATLIK